MSESSLPDSCCPQFIPTPWDDTILDWCDRKFIKARVFTFMYIPLNFGSVITRLFRKTEAAGVKIPDGLCLSDHTSRWNMDIYLAVDNDVPGMENVAISGKFLSRVYEGDFKETGNWCKDFSDSAARKSLNISKLYMWYTTCPKCAKKYGKNYVVILGKIA